MNEVEDCGGGYFFDGKSGRCIGNYYLFLYIKILFCIIIKDHNNRFDNLHVADVDECANEIATCSVNERCVNMEGGYRCSPICPPGFRLRNISRLANKVEEVCEDINECFLGLHTCNSQTHYCVNTNGSYVCGTLTTTTSALETTISSTTRRPFIGSRYNKVQVLGNNFTIYWITSKMILRTCTVRKKIVSLT